MAAHGTGSGPTAFQRGAHRGWRIPSGCDHPPHVRPARGLRSAPPRRGPAARGPGTARHHRPPRCTPTHRHTRLIRSETVNLRWTVEGEGACMPTGRHRCPERPRGTVHGAARCFLAPCQRGALPFSIQLDAYCRTPPSRRPRHRDTVGQPSQQPCGSMQLAHARDVVVPEEKITTLRSTGLTSTRPPPASGANELVRDCV